MNRWVGLTLTLRISTSDMHIAAVDVSIFAGEEETDVGTVGLRLLSCSDEGVICDDFTQDGAWALTVCDVPRALDQDGYGFTPYTPACSLGAWCGRKTGLGFGALAGTPEPLIGTLGPMLLR